MKILFALGLLAALGSSGSAFAFHGIGPVIPSEALENCSKLGGVDGIATIRHDTHATCLVPKKELRAKMIELGLIPSHKNEDEACAYWQEDDEPNPGRVNCEISYWALDHRL